VAFVRSSRAACFTKKFRHRKLTSQESNSPHGQCPGRNEQLLHRIVLRGLGPSLSAFGVSNPLTDPTLELRDQNGNLLKANNDWADDLAQAAEITAAGLAPLNSKESGIAANLPPGLYTAILAGLNGGQGVGTVEV
jgi:hypothetical protein